MYVIEELRVVGKPRIPEEKFTVGVWLNGSARFMRIKHCKTRDQAMRVIHFLNGGPHYDEEGKFKYLHTATAFFEL